MRLQVISDVHTEFHVDRGVEWASKLPISDGCDALVVAGDFGVHHTWSRCMSILVSRFPFVIAVAGNHEYYGSSIAEMQAEMRIFDEAYSNFRFLENDVIELCGRRVLGTTLWFERTSTAVRLQPNISDFSAISDSHTIYSANAAAREFLEREVRKDDVVVTHHLPTQLSVSPRFAGAPMNCFFVCSMSHVLSRGPVLWIHGHTHDSKDYIYGCGRGNTRIVCNPFGYPNALNPSFDDAKVIDV
jgi:predicted phosphohydrolase